MTTTRNALPLILDTVEVVRVDRLSPSFVRFELGGACLAELGVDGPMYDQRIKLVFPGVPGGPLPSFEGADESWWETWLSRPEEERGHMRTYTIRDVVGEGVDTRLVVDIVVHPDDHGDLGPGCDWAARARVGDQLVVLALDAATSTAASSSGQVRRSGCCSWATRPRSRRSARCWSSCRSTPGARPSWRCRSGRTS